MEAAGDAVLLNEWSFQELIDAFERFVWELENEPLLFEPNRLRERLEALDRLDAYFPDGYFPDGYFPDASQQVFGAESIEPGLYRRARAICARLEAVNGELYEGIRGEIQRGDGPDALLRWVDSSPKIDEVAGLGGTVIGPGGPVSGMGYDYLDELISGVFQFEEPDAGPVRRESEMVFYQPTPARHIFGLIGLTALTETDVLVDLGSGLGHVPLLVSICTGARSIGIELEAAYVERAQQCAEGLKLNRVTFLQQDARAADLSIGTVFYLHTPFTGSILRRVLNLLRREAATRRIRICTYGPCTPIIAEEPWLEAAVAQETDRIVVFCSRD